MFDPSEWCRDEQCSIEELHLAHEVVLPAGRGRPRGSCAVDVDPVTLEIVPRKRGRPRTPIYTGEKWSCPRCRGTGWEILWTLTCSVCQGVGKLRPIQAVRVRRLLGLDRDGLG